MRAVINQNQATLFDLNTMKKPEGNISLRFNKAVGLIDLIPTYTKENTLFLMEILIFWAQKAFREGSEFCFIDSGNQWYSIPFNFIEGMLNYKKSDNRNLITAMFKELSNVKVEYNFLEGDNTINPMYRLGFATIISQVNYLAKEKTKKHKKYSDNIDYAFSPLFNDLVKTPKIFANIDLMISKKLHSVSARQLYQHCKYTMQIRKQTEGMSELSFDELKKLSGKQNVDVNYSIYNRDVLKRDKEKINEKTDINLDYIKKRGEEKIVFTFKQKDAEPTLFDNLKNEPTSNPQKPLSFEQQEVNDLFIKYKIDTKIREEFFKEYSCRRMKDNIKYSEEAFKQKNKTPTFSYIIKAIKEDYAKSEETIQLEEKTNLLAELKSIMFSWEGVSSKSNITHKHEYIGNTIYCFKKSLNLTEEDWNGYYFAELRKNIKSLDAFKIAVKEHTSSEFKRINSLLLNLQKKYNIDLEDACKGWNVSKADLFKRMLVNEDEFKALSLEI
ncbi:MAG: Initiator Replication protein [Bacteroidota bacterium]|nr:Initiator Replication protein [Bacteroidota bacterium]